MNHFADVIRFNEAARGDLPRTPTTLTLEQTKLCLRLLLEESFEAFEAAFDTESPVFKSLRSHKDAMQWILENESTVIDIHQNNVDLLDALCDTIVVSMGMAAMAGLPLNEGMDEVNRSNLAKIDPVTGRCIKDEGGKILKPKNWKKPDLKSVIEWSRAFGNRGDVVYEAPTATPESVEARLKDCGQYPENVAHLPRATVED